MKKTNKNMTIGISLGMCLGISVGLAFGQSVFGNMSMGMCLGLSIGMALGMAIGAAKDNEINKKAEAEGFEIKDIQEGGNHYENILIVLVKNGMESTVEISAETMASQKLCIGDIVFKNNDGTIVQAFDK